MRLQAQTNLARLKQRLQGGEVERVRVEKMESQRLLQRKAWNFFEYWKKGGRQNTPKGLQVANLADHVSTVSTEGKSQFLRDFFAGNGQKDPGSYMEQRVEIETTSKSADSEGYLTLSQIGDFLGIDKDSFEDISDYFQEVKKEVEDNQDEHENPEEKRKIVKGSVWRDRYFYSKKGEKVSEESHKTTNVVEKRAGASSSQGKEEPEPEVLVVETMKEKKSRAKKISQMLEVLMKMMQQARGLALQMKQKNALERGALLRLEAAENFWIEWSNREISLEEFEHLL